MLIRPELSNEPRATNLPENLGRHGQVSVLVAYDIADDRRRARLRRLLRGFGEPMQKSVFLCWLDASSQRRMTALLANFSNTEHTGAERIDCVPTRDGVFNRPDTEWVFE